MHIRVDMRVASGVLRKANACMKLNLKRNDFSALPTQLDTTLESGVMR